MSATADPSLNPRTLVAALLLLVVAGPAWAEAGRVLFVTGEATLVRADERPITKGMPVEAGDVLVTGADGRVQLLMADGDRIALWPDTRFGIDEFTGPSRVDPGHPVEGVRPSSWRSIYSLVSGGFRTLTHSLGQRDASSYQVRTPVATIGIRGTFYSARCIGDCGAGSGSGSGDGKNGLYTGVSGGTIWLQNGSGQHDVGDGLFAFVGGPDSIPRFFSEQPGVLNDTTEGGEGDWDEQVEGEGEGEDSEFSSRESPTEGAGGGESGRVLGGVGGGDNSPTQTITGTSGSGHSGDFTGGGQPPSPPPAPPSDTPRGLAISTGPMQLVHDDSTVLEDEVIADAGYVPSDTMRVDGNSNLTSFTADISEEGAPEYVGFTILDGTNVANVNTGQDLEFETGLRWGRWAGVEEGSSYFVAKFEDGSTSEVNLTDRSLHWIYGPSSGEPPAMPMTGYASYRLAGNTDPTDNYGNVGVLGSANFAAYFDYMVVENDLKLSVGGNVWWASGSGQIKPEDGSFKGGYYIQMGPGSDPNDPTPPPGCESCWGEFAGFFTPGGSDTTPPPGAGMGYSLSDGDDTTVSGSAAFGDPQHTAPPPQPEG